MGLRRFVKKSAGVSCAQAGLAVVFVDLDSYVAFFVFFVVAFFVLVISFLL